MSIQSAGYPIVAKFRGCMVGGLLGDCIGDPFEVEISRRPERYTQLGKFSGTDDKSKNKILTAVLNNPLEVGSPLLEYTDDTTMALSIAMSLVEKGMFDPKDMAIRFVDRFYENPYIGYGAAVVHVFHALKENGCSDVFGPAKAIFNGSGSYGNGAAMRIAPVALFGYKDEDLIKQIAERSSQITHTNQLGYNGAILQVLAVHQALLADTSTDFDPIQFIATLMEKMDKIEKASIIPWFRGKQRFYCETLKQMKQIFEKQPVNVSPEEAANTFGNSCIAQRSVPLALFSFLRGFQPLEDFESDNPFLRTLYFAIAAGGDTDTIACMAGNIAGAYNGESLIPNYLTAKCEAVEEIRNLGDQLFQLSQTRILTELPNSEKTLFFSNKESNKICFIL